VGSLANLISANEPIPAGTAWYLADLGEFRGKQELYTHQSPQRLKALREHAIVESAVSSNRIEDVLVDPARVQALFKTPKPLFRDRDEEEVSGYREALAWLHHPEQRPKMSEDTVLALHRQVRGQIWDAGHYKDKDGDIIERYPDGRQRVRFRTVSAMETPSQMESLLVHWNSAINDRLVQPLLALAAFNLDFLCIHPFRDGNGRVSRLLLLLQCYELGFEVGRYVSLERIIEQNKERYYETLEQSAQGWHEGQNDPWPFINFVLNILKTAYKEFVERVGVIQAPRGSKTEMVLQVISQVTETFTLAQLQQSCPGVSRDMIRRVLAEEKGKTVECIGRGPGAEWRRLS